MIYTFKNNILKFQVEISVSELQFSEEQLLISYKGALLDDRTWVIVRALSTFIFKRVFLKTTFFKFSAAVTR